MAECERRLLLATRQPTLAARVSSVYSVAQDERMVSLFLSHTHSLIIII